jgi:PKHD-type hydroxylase
MKTYAFTPPEQACFPPFVQWSGSNRFLSPPECDALIAIGNREALGFGSVGNGENGAHRVDRTYRQVLTRALYPEPDGIGWLYERIREKVTLANNGLFRFDLTGIEEGIQFLRYDAPPTAVEIPGHYKWHQDFGGGKSSLRKLSLVVQLSEPADYSGCRLRMFTDQDFEPNYASRGDAVMFPAWTPHMVSPITRGTRYALAAWVCGPQLR